MKKPIESREDFTLKKIRHYQASIDDYASYWERRIAEDSGEVSEETKSLKSKNDDLNKAFEIRPIEEDE